MERASLDGPLAKVGRARLHLHALHEHIRAFQDSEPYEFITEDYPQTGETIVRIKIHREPDPDWGLILGDFAHNLRSALDHLVWQLVLLSGGKPKRTNQFPIARTESEYRSAKGKDAKSMRDLRLAGVAEAHRAPIDVVQPYRAGDSAHLTSLAHLSWLSNVDKHRVIHGALVRTNPPDDQTFTMKTTASHSVADVSLHVGALEDGTEVMRLMNVVSTAPNAHVNVDAALPVSIGFGEKQFPAAGLADIYNWVGAYIEAFDAVFEGKPHPGLPSKPKP